MSFIARLFGFKKAIPNHYQDDNDLKKEIEEPVFELSECFADTEGSCGYNLTVQKPNCCFICKEILKEKDDVSYEEDETKIIGETKTESYLFSLCVNQKSWSEWNSASSLQRFQLASEVMQKGSSPKSYRRYCQECVGKLLLMQIEDQRATQFDLERKNVRLKCLICKDYAEITHFISKGKALAYLSYDTLYVEKFKEAYNRFMEERNINNKHCPVPDCQFYTKCTGRIRCPDHGTFCGHCFDKIKEDIESHKCPGIPKELRQIKGLRRCPSCKTILEKNGGCDHMNCVCGDEFYWHELKPIRPKKLKKSKKAV
jgi:hypothetical protein